MKILRWFITLPLAFLAICVAALAGLFVIEIGEWTCPSEYFISGTCMAPWSLFIPKLALALSSAIAGWYVVMLPSLVIPANPPFAALFYFFGGTALAIYIKLKMDEPQASIIFWTAIFTGGIAVFAVRFMHLRSKGPAAEISMKNITS